MKNFLNLRQSASNQRKPASRGFTLLELLVVISIIGLLASIALVSLDSARKKTRDTQRLSDMAGIQKAVRLYYEKNNQYPDNSAGGYDEIDCAEWDFGYYDSNDTFIDPLVNEGYFTKVPGDTVFEGCSGGSGGYRYNLYPAGSNGCDLSRGKFYILGVTNMESVSGQHLQSPGFKECGFDWYSAGFEWYAGSFEK